MQKTSVDKDIQKKEHFQNSKFILQLSIFILKINLKIDL